MEKYNEIQLTKNKMNLNYRKMKKSSTLPITLWVIRVQSIIYKKPRNSQWKRTVTLFHRSSETTE